MAVVSEKTYLSHQILADSQVSLSQSPQVAFSLSQSPSGIICAFATDRVFILRPIVSDSNLKFELISERLKNEHSSIIPSKLIGYITGRRWKQKSVSEVDFNPSQSMHQLELNIQIGKLTHKENDQSGKRLFVTRSVCSPLGWDTAGGSLLAVLTSLDSLFVYSCCGVASVNLKQLYFINQLLYESATEHPEDQCAEILWTESFQTMHEKMNRFCVASVEWSPTFHPQTGLPYVFLSCAMKDGKLLLWKLTFSEENPGLSLKLKYQNQFNPDTFTWINALSWSDTIQEKSAYLLMGFTDGTVSVAHFDINSHQLSISVIYAEQDDAPVLAITWSSSNEVTSVFLIKGCYLFMFSLSVDVKINTLNSSFLLADISHSVPVTSLSNMVGDILVGYRDCTFSLFEYGNSKLILLESESRELSEFIQLFIERSTGFRFEVLGSDLSPNCFYLILICVGSLIGRGRPSKVSISSINKIFFIPLLELSFVSKKLQECIPLRLDWDLIRLKLSPISHLYSGSTLPDAVRIKLGYISDFANGRLTSTQSTLDLLKLYLRSLQPAIINGINPETASNLLKDIMDLKEEMIEGKVELELPFFCEICKSRLELGENQLYFHCSNDHKLDRCLYTLKPLFLGDAVLQCGLCRKKVLAAVVREVSMNSVKCARITCPLCDGFLLP